MNLVSWLFEHTAERTTPAIIAKQGSVSYKELFSKVQGVARLLSSGKGPVIIISENSEFFISAFLGAIAAGRTAVPLPFSSKELEKVQSIASMCEAKVLFIQQKYHSTISKEFPQLLQQFSTIYTDSGEHALELDEGDEEGTNFAASHLQDCATILFTSGSSAAPKGVMLSHENIISNTKSIIEYLPITDKDKILIVLPFYYCYGLSFLYTGLRQGATLVINNTFMFSGTVFEDIKKHGCTGFAGVPSHFHMLLQHKEFSEANLPSMKFIAQAGGKLTNSFIEKMIQAFPNKKIYIMYGQTEATARLSYLPPDQLKSKIGSIGKGIPGTKLEVLKDGKPAKPGETGEIVASGANIMLGYYKQPKETKRVLHQSKLHTGDIATLDEEGFIYILDRESSFIKTSGVRVSSKEIEEKLYQYPGVIEAAVIGVADSVRGEAIKAFICLKTQATPEEILQWCKTQFIPEKTPTQVIIMQSLPKTLAGKIDAAELKRL